MSENYQLVCLNGHQKSIFISQTDAKDENNYGMCTICGEKLTDRCLNCGTKMEGYEGQSLNYSLPVPKYCRNCGKPFPWTVKELDSFDELLDLEENLKANEKQSLKKSVNLISGNDTLAKTNASIIKVYLSKADTVVGPLLYNFLVDFSSETAKKILTGS